eukprot:11079443-Alexandrium_andersonii.AAC.1
MYKAPEATAEASASATQRRTPKAPGRQKPTISPERLEALMAEHPGKAPEWFYEVERREGRKLSPGGT